MYASATVVQTKTTFPDRVPRPRSRDHMAGANVSARGASDNGSMPAEKVAMTMTPRSPVAPWRQQPVTRRPTRVARLVSVGAGVHVKVPHLLGELPGERRKKVDREQSPIDAPPDPADEIDADQVEEALDKEGMGEQIEARTRLQT